MLTIVCVSAQCGGIGWFNNYSLYNNGFTGAIFPGSSGSTTVAVNGPLGSVVVSVPQRTQRCYERITTTTTPVFHYSLDAWGNYIRNSDGTWAGWTEYKTTTTKEWVCP